MLRQSLTLLLGLIGALLVIAHSASARQAPEAPQGTPQGTSCPPPSRTLEGVWDPDRLLVLNPCQTITGTIDASDIPPYVADDGDVHNQFTSDSQYRNLLTDQQETYGNMVVELMPRDAGHLPALPVGPKLTLWGALVYDIEHAWNEIHPVFGVCVEDGSCYTSGPQFGGNPRESTGNTREACRTETGRICPGYEGQLPTYEEVKENGTSRPPT